MADTAATEVYSMVEIATHTTKESTWLVIKDLSDGGESNPPLTTAKLFVIILLVCTRTENLELNGAQAVECAACGKP